jgi:hypothetical protein
VLEKLRWRIAYLLDRLPGQCWADLVSWALDGMRVARRNDRNPLPWRPNRSCQQDARTSRDRCCYCNKLGPDGKVRRA